MPPKIGSSKKSAFRSYSEEDIAATEFGTFVIQVGEDFLATPNGKMAFSLQRAESLYDDVLGGLQAMKKEGNEVEQADAEKCLLLLRIMPLRIH